MEKRYYLDTCIWVNLIKKEVNKDTGLKYWKYAREFIKEVEEIREKIIVSTIVLKELYFTSENKFHVIKNFFKESDFIEIIKTNPEDYSLAREWENTHKKLSFYDYLHVAIAKRLNLIMVTRDTDLINFAKEFIQVSKPEDLLG